MSRTPPLIQPMEDLLDYFILGGPKRHQRLRSGERAGIPYHVRIAVYERDGWRCAFCGHVGGLETVSNGDSLHLDHIIPWSAGGSDASVNLRTLCGPCNLNRSNFRDQRDRQKLPCTWYCRTCCTPDNAGDDGLNPDDCTVLAYCVTCRRTDYTDEQSIDAAPDRFGWDHYKHAPYDTNEGDI